MRIVGIILARLNSVRLPKKVMSQLCGKPALWHIIERTKRATIFNAIVLAIPHHDIELETIASKCGIGCFRYSGAENDVIGRLEQCAESVCADLIVRINGDNWFVDPAEIDRAVEWYMNMPSIFVSNMHNHNKDSMLYKVENGYPDGIGCEVFSMSRLKWMNEIVNTNEYREHPHMIFHRMKQITSPPCPTEISRPDLRLDVNTQTDLDYVRSIYEIVYPKNPQFTTKEVIDAIDIHHLERRQVPA